VKREVDAQIKQMLHFNTETEAKMGAPVFNDSDLQMAGYAAALKVLTGYTSIGGEDVTTFALRPRRKGDTTVVDEIVEQAAETANSLLVPEGLDRETWAVIGGIQRFYLRMLDMETTGASKLDNYQNFAKAFRVRDYAAVMASIKPNAARLKSVTELKPRDLTDRTEIGPTPLGALIVAIQEFPGREGAGCGDGESPRGGGGLSVQAPGADEHGRLHPSQGSCSRRPSRSRGHRQPHPPPAVTVTQEDLSRRHGDLEMKLVYYEEDDIRFMEFSKGSILGDESVSWNVNIGYTADGLGEITILDAQKSGIYPLQIERVVDEVT
jgi:hypothetical protein